MDFAVLVDSRVKLKDAWNHSQKSGKETWASEEQKRKSNNPDHRTVKNS